MAINTARQILWLNKQILGVAFFIIIVELLVVTFLIDAARDKVSGSLITSKIETEQTVASQVAHSLKQDLLSVVEMLNLVATSPEIQTGAPSNCQTKLDQLFPIMESKIANILRIDKEGLVYCALNRSSVGTNTLQNSHIKKLLLEPEHQKVVGRVILSPVSDKHVVGIHVPVFTKSGEFKGSIGGVIYLDELERKYFKDFKLLKSGQLFLIDDNGDVLYHQALPQLVGKNLLSEEILSAMPIGSDYKSQVERVLDDIKKDKSSFARYHYPPGPETVASYYPVEILPDRHWAVVVSLTIDDITSQVDKDPLVLGLKNFSALSLAVITVIMVTQISLFIYLIAFLNPNQ